MEGAPDFRDDVTEDEKFAVAAVRKLLRDRKIGKRDSDGFVARFVRARGGDVVKAAKMLEECLDWREREKVDTIFEWWPEQESAKRFSAYYPFENSDVYGLARDGVPVNLDHYPLIEPSTVLNSFDADTIVKEHILSMERALDWVSKASIAAGKPVTDQIFVFNMEGLAFRHLHGDVMTAVKECFQIDEKFYPELVRCALVINAPRVFTLLYKLISPLVDPVTLSKTKVLGSDWHAEADRFLLPENLPEQWGGKGPKWTKFAGGFVLGGDSHAQQTAELVVPARGATSVPFRVEGDGHQLAYEFSSVDYDVEFGVVRVGAGGEKTWVEKSKRYNSHEEPVQGMVGNLKTGDYEIVFDNAYSWTTAKTVTCTFYVSAPPSKSKSKKKREKKAQKKKKNEKAK